MKIQINTQNGYMDIDLTAFFPNSMQGPGDGFLLIPDGIEGNTPI